MRKESTMSHLNIAFEQGATPDSWVAEKICSDDRRRQPSYFLPITATVLLAHMGLVALLVTHTSNREISLASVAPASSIRVTMVAPPPPPPPEPPVEIQPVPPTPQVMTTANAQRTVAVEKPKPLPKPIPLPKPKPKPVPHTPPPEVTKVEPAPPAVTPAVPAPSGASDKLLELPAAGPKDVQTVGCRVPAPEYPRGARRLRLQGNVVVRMVIDTNGRIQTATIARSSGNEELDDAARKAVMAASCAPYMENGRAIAVRAAQPVSFRLDR